MSKLKALLSKMGPKELARRVNEKLVPETRVLSYELKANVAKSGFFRPEYSFDVPISSVNVDRDGQRMSESFLEELPSRYSELYGYYENEHPEGFSRGSDPDFLMDSIRYENGKLVGTVHILREGPNHKDIVREFKDGRPRGVSVELKRALVSSDDVILDAESVNGFIITSDPANRDTLTRFDVL